MSVRERIDDLLDTYWGEWLSTVEIAGLLRMKPNTVYQTIRRHPMGTRKRLVALTGFPRRTRAEFRRDERRGYL